MRIGPIVDDRKALAASVERLKKLKITTVYPGHGASFAMRDFPWPEPASR
jgi:glyoxylase-like metal-dependent hydrolase (beta-lactamase superfamily II)